MSRDLTMASRVHTRFYQVPAYPLYQLEAAYFWATFVPIEVEPGHAAPTPDALAAAFREQRHPIFDFCADSATGAAGGRAGGGRGIRDGEADEGKQMQMCTGIRFHLRGRKSALSTESLKLPSAAPRP